MKKFYKITIACLITGLVLMGIGSAMMLLGINSFTYMGSKYTESEEELTKSIELQLPENLAKIYNEDFGSSYELVIDESLEGNNAVLDVTYSSKEDVEVSAEFKDNYYLYNMFTENFSKYPVNCFSVGWGRTSVSDKSDFERFKEIMRDFKQKEVYDYNDYGFEPELTLRVSKEGYERFAKLSEGYYLNSYGEYMNEMKEREEESQAAIYEQYGISDDDYTCSEVVEE